MGKPAVRSCSMPVLDFRRDAYHIAGVQFPWLAAPFLVVTATRSAQEDLSAVVMDMPVVPAPRLKGDVGNGNAAFTAQRTQVACPAEIPASHRVGITLRKQVMKCFAHRKRPPISVHCRLGKHCRPVPPSYDSHCGPVQKKLDGTCPDPVFRQRLTRSHLYRHSRSGR